MKVKIIKDNDGDQSVSYELVSKDLINFYRLSIIKFEQLVGDSTLSERELDFLACALLNFERGRRDLYSDESVKIFTEVGKFNDKQEVRVYTRKDRIKKWLYKEGRDFKMPKYAENLLTAQKTTFNFTIKLEDK